MHAAARDAAACDRRPADARGGVREPKDACPRCDGNRAVRAGSRGGAGAGGRVGEPVRLQHRARHPPGARAGARRPLRHAGGGRADAPRAAAGAARGAARGQAQPAGRGHAGPRGLRGRPRGARPGRRARHDRAAVGPATREGGGVSSGAKVLRPYVLRQWRALAGAAGASGVLALAELAKPWPLALIVDHLLDQRTAPFDLTGEDVKLLIAVGALILAISIGESLANYFADYWLQSPGERITHELRVAIYDHLQRLSLAFHQRSQKGDLLTRVTGDVNAMGNLFSDTLGEMVQSALLAVGMTLVLLWIDPVLALLSLITTPVLVTLSFVFRRRVRERARRQRRHEGDLASVANEALSAMAVVKAFGAEDRESERVRRRSEQRLGVGIEVARLQARFDGYVGVLRATATAIVTIAGVYRVARGELSAGDLIVFVSYTRKAHSPMRSFAREASKLTAALARADRVAEVLSADEVLPDGHYHGGRARGEIALEEVSFAFAGERPALDGVSLTV